MPGIETVPEIVKVTTTMIPALQNIRLVRGLIVPLSNAGTMNEAKALEELQRSADKNKQARERARDRYKAHVIKVNDAMKCVEDAMTARGGIVLILAKAILNTITSGVTGNIQDATDLMHGRVLGCMINKMLQQRNRRSKGKYVKEKGPGIPEGETFTELVRVRRGKLHPFIPR